MLTFTNNGRTYQWLGGFGAIFVSHERWVAAGDVRMIEGELFYVYMVRAGVWPWNRRHVSWTQADVTIEHIRELRAKIFGCESAPALIGKRTTV